MADDDAVDLVEFFREVARGLPSSVDDEHIFTTSNLPEPPPVLQTDALVLLRGWHAYDAAWRIDSPRMFASRHCAASLGLLTIAMLLHRRPRVDLRLSHAASDLRLVRIDEPAQGGPGLRMHPSAFHYWPTQPHKHPWLHELPSDPWDLPTFTITNETGGAATEEEFAGRDVLEGFGTAAGCARFAALLLDVSRPTNKRHEFDLECEGGFRGVSPLSAELSILLPGFECWPPEFDFGGGSSAPDVK